MRCFHLLLVLLQALLSVAQFNNTGLTDLVEWDKYSLVVNNERVFVLAGEIHYERLPVRVGPAHTCSISSTRHD